MASYPTRTPKSGYLTVPVIAKNCWPDNLPVRTLIALTWSRSIGFVQLILFSPDISFTGNGLFAEGDRAMFSRAKGPVRTTFHAYIEEHVKGQKEKENKRRSKSRERAREGRREGGREMIIKK